MSSSFTVIQPLKVEKPIVDKSMNVTEIKNKPVEEETNSDIGVDMKVNKIDKNKQLDTCVLSAIALFVFANAALV